MLFTCTKCGIQFRCNQSDRQFCYPDKGVCSFIKCINCSLEQDEKNTSYDRKLLYQLSKLRVLACFNHVLTKEELDTIFLVHEL
jgi:hypothetical protein